MADTNPVAEALALLSQQRANLADELKRVDEAINALKHLVGKRTAPSSPEQNRPSVRTKLVTLLEEEPRDWSAGEILSEYERRGDPVHGQDPANALRAAFADAKKKGMIVSTSVGRYKAAKWQDGHPAADPPPPSNGSEAATDDATEPEAWPPRPSREVMPRQQFP